MKWKSVLSMMNMNSSARNGSITNEQRKKFDKSSLTIFELSCGFLNFIWFSHNRYTAIGIMNTETVSPFVAMTEDIKTIAIRPMINFLKTSKNLECFSVRSKHEVIMLPLIKISDKLSKLYSKNSKNILAIIQYAR